ncbi:hypothetical protein QJQ45_014868 [Haematococcus lacustris]|nr:hypothetical protein QJQ45_014868 [Haematococcus lacustris]
MARKKRRTGVGGPRAVPEDPDFNRDEAAQPDLTEAQRKRKALGKARADRSRDNTFHARKAKLAHLIDHLPQALLGCLPGTCADQLDAQGQPLSYTDTDIPVSAADIPDLNCDNLFRQLCRGLPGEGERTRPSAAVAAVLAAHPDLRARLEAIPRYLSDTNMVDHVGQQLQTSFSNILTLLFAGRLKKAVSLAGAKVLLGTNEHQRRFGVRGLVGGHLPAWSKRQCTYVRRMVCGLEVTWLVGEGGVVVTAAMQAEVALQRGLLGLGEGEKVDHDWVDDPANLGRLLRHAVHTTKEMEAAMAAWQLDMVPWEQSQPTNLLTRPPRPPTPYALTPTSKCKARHVFIDTRGLYGMMRDAGMLGVLTEQGVTSLTKFRNGALPDPANPGEYIDGPANSKVASRWDALLPNPRRQKLASPKHRFAQTVDTDGVAISVMFLRPKPAAPPAKLPRMAKGMDAVNPLAHLHAEWLGVDPGKTNMATVAHEERSADGSVVSVRHWTLTAGQYYRDSGITRQAQATKIWLAQVKTQLTALTHVSSKPSSLASYRRFADTVLATYDAIWAEVSKPRWANAKFRLYCGKMRVVASFWAKVNKQAKKLWPDRILALAYGAAGFKGSGTIGCRGVPVSQMQKEAVKQFRPGRVVLVDEFRTSRVSSADNTPSETLLDTPPESFRWLQPVKSMAKRSQVRGLMCLTSINNITRFYDRDVSAALNIRRCAVGPGPRPTELCYWTNRPAMPKPGEPGQDWVEIPDKPLRAHQQMTSKERHYAKFKRKAFVVRSIAEISDRTESGADMKKQVQACTHACSPPQTSIRLPILPTVLVLTLNLVLGWPELLFLGIGCILGAGIVVLTGVAARKYAGPAVVLSYLMSAVAALLTSFCYAEFAADLPVVGGAFNYVGLTFGEFAAWVAACDLILEYTLSAAAVAKGFTAYFAQLIGVNLSRLRLQASIFTLDFPALLAVVVASLVLARSTRESSLLNSVVVALHLLLVIFVFAAGEPTTSCIPSCCTASNPPAWWQWQPVLSLGFPHVKEENYHPFMPFGIRGCFTGASVVFFSYVGFDTVATAAEEVKHPGRDLPIGIVGSLSICTVFYVLMCIVISGMQPYTEIDLHAPFSVAFQAVGLDWADKIIAGGAITGIVTSLLGSLLGQARIYVTLGRQHLLPKWLAQVDAASGTPRNATYLTMFTAGILALFLDIEVLSELVSIGALVVFTMVCAGVLFRRCHVRGLGDSARPVGLRLVGIALTSIAFSLSFTERAPLLLPLFFLLAWLAITLSFYRLPVLYTPTLFKCPGSPWVPSLGMLTCLHLIGSLGWPAYVRWIVWFALGTVVYVTYSMHHSQGEGKGAKPPGSEGGSVSAGSSPLLLDRHSHSSDPGNATQLTLSPWLHTGLTQDDGSSVSKGRGRDSGGGLGDGNGGVEYLEFLEIMTTTLQRLAEEREADETQGEAADMRPGWAALLCGSWGGPADQGAKVQVMGDPDPCGAVVESM